MALGACFHHGGTNIDFSQPGIGLDQSFYEQLFHCYKNRKSESVLKAIVSIGYDDELILSKNQLLEALHDLEKIAANHEFNHPQTAQFCTFLSEAVSNNCKIIIWGDMYPDLSKVA